MKYFTLTLFLTALSVFSVASQAADKELVVFDATIIQEQYGTDLQQEAAIATVSGNNTGKVTIVVSGSTIVQMQTGSGNVQRARIGTVTCNCGN